MAEQPVSTDSRPADPPQTASLPHDLNSALYSSTISSPPGSDAKQRLPDVSAPSSTPFKGPRILKGTGPALDPTSSHRQRPDVNYNLKELSHQSRTPAKNLEGTTQPPVSQQTNFRSHPWIPTGLDNQNPVPAVNGHAQQTHDAQQPSAKRQRVNEGSNSPAGWSQGHVWDASSELQGPVSAAANVNQELIAYVWPILHGGGVTDPGELLGHAFYKPFLCLPRKRDIVWNLGTNCNRWSFKTKIDVVALLVQLTGDQSPRCNKCNPEIGLFKGCIAVTTQALATNYYGCANCLYHGRQTFCSLKGWNQRAGMLNIAHEHFVPNGIVKSALQQGKASQAMITNTQVINSAVQQGEANQAVATNTPIPQNVPLSGEIGSFNASTRSSDIKPREPPLIEARILDETPKEPSEILSMELWERAPGRIRSQASANPESKCAYLPMRYFKLTVCLDIAFSKSYLATGAEVQVCREATFRVEIIRSGHMHKLNPEDNVVRICSVASAGKLLVKMDGEEPLVIGPHGMFTVRPRSACLVESEIYDDVALHITSVKTE